MRGGDQLAFTSVCWELSDLRRLPVGLEAGSLGEAHGSWVQPHSTGPRSKRRGDSWRLRPERPETVRTAWPVRACTALMFNATASAVRVCSDVTETVTNEPQRGAIACTLTHSSWAVYRDRSTWKGESLWL